MTAAFVIVDHNRCDRCGGCVAVCAPLALVLVDGRLEYDEDRCTSCGDCVPTCPYGALRAA